MRQLSVFIISLCFVISLKGQNKTTQYQFKLSDLTRRTSGSIDTVTVNDDFDFKISVDTTGLNADLKYKIFFLHGDDKEDVSAKTASLNLNMKDHPLFSLEFEFCDKAVIDENVKKSFTKLKFSFDSTVKTQTGQDTIVKIEGDIDVATEDLSGAVIILNGKGKRISVISAPIDSAIKSSREICKDVRTYTVLFRKNRIEKSQSEKTFDAQSERLSAIFNQQPEAEPIGEIILLTSDVAVKLCRRDSIVIRNGDSIRIYRCDTIIDRSKVKRVEITFAYGAIGRRLLRVELANGSIYFNKSAPVSLPIFFSRKTDKLYRYDGRKTFANEYIELGDVLDYHYFGHFNYPSDGTITLDKDKLRDTLTVGSSLNSLLDVSIYTDLLGLLGNTANGLIQTEVAGNFISNSGNLRNADIVFHNFMRPYLRLSRFDSKYKSLDSANIKVGGAGKDTVNRTYLNQISYLQGGLLLNVVRFGLGVNQLIYLNAGADLNLVNADSSYKKDITFFNYYTEVNYSISRLRNFGMDCSIRFLNQIIGRSAKFVNTEGIWIIKPQITLYFYPSKDQSSKIYMRFNYFDNLNDHGYNFAQFQVGLKTNLKLNKKD